MKQLSILLLRQLAGMGIAVMLMLPLPGFAAGPEPYPLGEALVTLPEDWEITDQRGDAEVDLVGPHGESLMIYWWFPDEPLTGYDGAPPSETVDFPMGQALLRREMAGTRATVSSVFEWLNADGERLIFLLESESQDLAELETTLTPLLRDLRFVGVPLAAPTTAKATSATEQPALDFAKALAAASLHFGGDCATVDAASQPATAALSALGVAVEAAAFCPGQAVPLVAIRLAQDPATGQSGLAGMAYVRAFLAAGRKPVGLIDLAHGVLIALAPDGAAGFSVALHDLKAANAIAVPATSPVDFIGTEGPEWLPYAVQGGNFDAWARYDAGALVVAVPEGRNTRTTGLRSASAFVHLPRPGAAESLRIRIGLDPARSSNVVFALVAPHDLGAHDWGVHEIWLALEERQVGMFELTLAVQQKVQARIPLPPAADLAALEMQVRPDGVILVAGDQGRVLLEGRRAEVPKSDAFHVQISASATQGVATGLVLNLLRFDTVPFVGGGDPAAVLGDVPQQVVLFDGASMAPHLEPYNSTRLTFADMARFDVGALVLSLPKDQHTGEIGLFAPEALVWLDRFTDGAQVRLRVEIDPAQTTGFQIALSGGLAAPDAEAGKPRYLLHWRQTKEGTLRASHMIDAEVGLVEVTPAAMPKVVELDLTPAGIRVLAAGFPDDLLPWPLLVDGQGLRLLVTAKGDAAGQPVTLALRRISLIRTPGAPAAPPEPQIGVEPLPVAQIFPAAPGVWEPYDLSGMNFAETAHFDAQGGLIVEKPGKYERPRAGILSAKPVARLDDRLASTPYRLALTFDPGQTDGFEALLSNHKQADMWGDSSVLHLSLLRNQQGMRPDDWVLTLTQRYWYTWTRRLTAQDMAAWDGRLWLDLAPSTATLTLPGVVSHRGATFNGLAKGAALYLTVHSASAIRYGPTRMALSSITAGWVTPAGMTARQRMTLQDTADFDADAFLDLLNAEVTEALP
ncbi:MAG: hypothetical protein U1A24_10520 [Cypionkella sp.]|uniref:hypothetical protein n=1 Tax=Cypionkella sp. TaxID=2811411 RepID=UPI002AB9CA52|nr:hypothetical protein [Cypionkella sp.]MDZ4310972.1 hypothetical protein [Cypionkella sp.]